MKDFSVQPSDNPFAAPVISDHPMIRSSDGGNSYDPYPRQVPIVGSLMIAQGGLESLYGLFLYVLGGIITTVGSTPQRGEPPQWIVIFFLAIFGTCILGLGVLRIISGVFVLRRRRRILATVVNCLGLGTAFTCYCAPTSIAICIYSLIVLLQPTVAVAFAQESQA